MRPPLDAVGVVGAGAVGQAVATVLLASGLACRLLVSSRTIEQAAALVADLEDMRAATGAATLPCAVHTGEMADCQAVVIAARATFTNTHSSDVRMGGARANAPMIRMLAAVLRGYSGTVVMVTNPVDLMSRLFAEFSCCRRVFGIGSNLDSARYRAVLARLLEVPADAVAGHVIGEHGDHAVICTSSTTVAGLAVPVPVPVQQIRDELRTRPGRINAGIGRTRCGPAGAVLSTLRLVTGIDDGLQELSAPYLDGWLGIPLRFTRAQPTPCLPALNEAEAGRFDAAHAKLHTAYRALLDHPLAARNP